MLRSFKLALLAGLLVAMVSGIAYAATRPVPEQVPGAKLQNTVGTQLPGDQAALDRYLNAAGPVNYKILVIETTDGEDKTAYLDRVAATWDEPKENTLLLVLFKQDNWDIRFFMGARFGQAKVSVNEMLTLVRQQYLARSQKGDVAGGLAALMEAVNQRMSAAQGQ